MEQKILAYLKEHETEIFEDLKSLVYHILFCQKQ